MKLHRIYGLSSPVLFLVALFTGCVPPEAGIQEPQPTATPHAHSITLRLTGELPADGALLLQDSSGTRLAVLPAGSAGTYTFPEALYLSSQHYPFRILYFQDTNGNSSCDEGAETVSLFLLTTVDFTSTGLLSAAIPAQTIARYTGVVQFAPAMGTEPARRYIYVENRQDASQRLVPVTAGGSFAFHDKGFADPGRIFLYALYDSNGNSQPNLLADRIAILASPAGNLNYTINRELVKLEGWADLSPFSLGGSEQFIVECDDRTAGSLLFCPVAPDGTLTVFTAAGHYTGFSLYRAPLNTQDERYHAILKDASFLGQLCAPAVYAANSLLMIDNYNLVTTQAFKILYLKAAADSLSTSILPHARAALATAKLPWLEADLDTYQVTYADLRQYAVVVIATEYVDRLDTGECDDLKKFVNRGGGLVFLTRGWHSGLSDLIGVSDAAHPGFFSESAQAGDDENNTYDYGLSWTADFFPGLAGLKMETWISCMGYSPLPQADVFMQGIRSGAPLAWRYGYGDGRVVYWNNSLVGNFYFRGLLLQSILDVQQVGLAPVINAGVFIIDDFPLPFYDYLVLEPMVSYETAYLGWSLQDFYVDGWLPDILALAAAHDFKYTFAIPFNYNNNTLAPWDFDEWLDGIDGSGNPLGPLLGRQLRDAGHELALHGYNHISLSLSPAYSGALVWPSQSSMEAALTAARSRWILDFGSLPVSYIPPHNKYDSTGLAALHNVFPEIRNLCGALDSTNELVYYPEGFRDTFGAEPWDAHFLTIPRYTAGYPDTLDKRLAVAAQLSLWGIWTHYIHPDDLFDNLDNNPAADPLWLRNPQNLNWQQNKYAAGDGLYPQLSNFISWVHATYPWLNHAQARDLNQLIPAFSSQTMELTMRKAGSQLLEVEVYSPQSGGTFQLRAAAGMELGAGNLTNLQILYQSAEDGYTFYMLQLSGIYGRIALPQD